MSAPRSPASDRVLAQLKDFQRRTVDVVFERLTAPDGSKRFLVADEVGLGKTMVAKGVISKMVDHLRGKVDRIDVVYICSNADIAQQNIKRLRLDGQNDFALPTRLTLLPQLVRKLKQASADDPSTVNFISLTPDTSFNLKSASGRIEERVLIASMLRQIWDFGAAKPPLYLLSAGADSRRFAERVHAFSEELDKDAVDQFAKSLHDQPELRTRFFELCGAFPRSDSNPGKEVNQRRNALVGELRMILAAACVQLLEPDLVILDEFQRFPRLLDEQDESAQLARQVFRFSDPKLASDGAPTVHILLLSATPYRMFTRDTDDPNASHYQDFIRTVGFLETDVGPERTPVHELVEDYSSALYDLAEDGTSERLERARAQLEARLRRVMVRTERLASTPDRNGMLVAKRPDAGHVHRAAVGDYAVLHECSELLEERDCLEPWKSVPFLLSFLDDESYAFKRRIIEAISEPSFRPKLAKLVGQLSAANVEWDAIRTYGRIEPAHARLGALARDVIENDAWRLLWVPPSAPYTALSGPFANPALVGFTKRLVFSSWRAAPRAIASILSYLAEQRMVEAFPDLENSPDGRKRRWAPLLRFAKSDGRLTGMPVLALLYPSLVLARLGDPLSHAALSGGLRAPPALEDFLSDTQARIAVSLARLPAAPTEGPIDERWYWAAPLLLDQILEPNATRAWMNQSDLAQRWAGTDGPEEDASVWTAHVDEAVSVLSGSAGVASLGRQPDDLLEVLALLAVASPATCLLRALDRVVSGEGQLDTQDRVRLRNAAGSTAWGFRSLFNQPEVIAMLRTSREDTPYWRLCLEYCAQGCLQAVLDEYVHVLIDHLGLQVDGVPAKAADLAGHIVSAMSLRTAQLKADDVRPTDGGLSLRRESHSLRTHFALRLADITSDDDQIVARSDQVRKAFNSPFWPFVVATTSIGQEGLDFHMYCHAVVHWNLPSNPVDLEQREGRVHRYKGHAVRKNVAQAFADIELDPHDDLWRRLFEEAVRSRAPSSSDIEPFWVFPGEARIERHLPHVPFSQERQRAPELIKALSVYRMVFGQPRQEDLMRYLLDRIPEERREEAMRVAVVDLAPRIGQ